MRWTLGCVATLALGCAAQPATPPAAAPVSVVARPVARVVMETPSLVTAEEEHRLHAAILASLGPAPEPSPSEETSPLEPLERAEPVTASADEGGRLPPESIRRAVRQSSGRFRACYERALLGNPEAKGRILVRFSIGSNGRVWRAEERSASLRNRDARHCVLAAFFDLTFPSPPGRTVVVDYPLSFSQDGSTPPDPLPNARRVAEPPPPGFAEAMRSGRRAVPPSPAAPPPPLRLPGTRRTRCAPGDPMCPDL